MPDPVLQTMTSMKQRKAVFKDEVLSLKIKQNIPFLLYRTTFFVKSICKMDFDNFPNDKQNCSQIFFSMRRQKEIKWVNMGLLRDKDAIFHPDFNISAEPLRNPKVTSPLIGGNLFTNKL